MLVGGNRFARYRGLFLIVAVALFCLPAGVWWLAARLSYVPWPSGSGTIGLTCGLIAGLIVLFEMALWLRKRFRGHRLGAVRVWMMLHIWLGLLSLPLALCHSGFSLGGSLSSLVMLLFLAAVFSGVWGLWMQQTIPRRLLDEVPEESIVTQLDHVMRLKAREAESIMERWRSTAEGSPDGAGGVATRYRLDQLLVFYEQRIIPYLQQGPRARGPLTSRARSITLFAELRLDADDELRETIDQLEAICETRRQLDVQARLHFWLHGWLCVHLPVSVALTVLLMAHILFALKFW